MYLKKLETFGFKSFADKLVFDFEPGFTCIVGPNGCGKSNVVDAVKWVLGEQSAKSLRGGEMLDVIFNGSAHRKPLNFAEVTLTFTNPTDETGRRILPLDLDEISVSRRLYRSGDSEYMINKALCRLRDIRELFYDTGIGTSSYSIIEQGRISQLLEANHKERRELFEEAAGIHKFKERKKAAQRRLERMDNNLARVYDRLGEVESNLRKVTVQAEKARKAQEIKDEYQRVRSALLLHEGAHARGELQELHGALGEAQEQVSNLAAELSQAQGSSVAEQEAMALLDHELNQIQGELADAKAQRAGLAQQIQHNQRSIEEWLEEANRARRAAQEAGERAAALAQERERAELDLQTATQRLADRTAFLEQHQPAFEGLRQQNAEAAKRLESARHEARDVFGRRGRCQENLAREEAALGGVEYRLRKAEAEQTKAEGLLRQCQREAEEAQRRLELTERRLETLERDTSGLRNLLARTEQQLKDLDQRMRKTRSEREKVRSRRLVLEDLTRSGEGLSSGVRAVMTKLRHETDLDAEVHGLVADLFRVQPAHEIAIERALGDAVEGIVTDSDAAAFGLLERLKRDALGRATFFPLRRLSAWHARLSARPAAPTWIEGCLGRAADLVEFSDAHRPLAEQLLGEVLVFDTLEHAEASYKADLSGSHWRRVTLAGETLEPHGSFTGGATQNAGQGLIARRNEIERLLIEEDRLDVVLGSLAEANAFLEVRAQRLTREEETLTTDAQALRNTATEWKGVLNAVQRDQRRSQEDRDAAHKEARELLAEQAAHQGKAAELRVELEKLKEREAETAALVAEGEQQLEHLRREEAEKRQALEDARNDAAKLRERKTGLERHNAALSAQFAERRDEHDREAARAQQLDARRTDLESSLGDQQQRLEALVEGIQTREQQSNELLENKLSARSRFDDARGKERALSTQLESARTSAGELERRQVELSLRLDRVRERLQSEFELTLEAELEARGGAPEVTEDMPAEAEALEKRLQRLGPVNMYALEEQKQLEKRFNFLKEQAGDLESARASLRDVIARINRRSRKQFQDTFEAVREHFQEIFRKLFGGGKADLVLEDGEDILEAGIDIVARPPGKEPRSIMQLSGGEKAMTTIALLFAVFRSRPAPFCILDEVDAPLDEANVDRFNHIIREFMDRSQFMVISHNKKTMGYADMMYGITMPEPGVSKRLAIKFEEVEKHFDLELIDREAKQKREKLEKQYDLTADSNAAEPVKEEIEVEVEADMAMDS